MENPRSGHYAAGPSGSTRATSPRQLPTDHDYAVPTREYQSDQPSRFGASTVPRAACVERMRCVDQRANLTGSFHISGLSTLIKDQLAGGASRLAALLLPQILPVFTVVAPCHPGAALRDLALVQHGQATRTRTSRRIA